ncbi:MAG TPA: porin [Steroidobacteraceae bacterium]|nr:porin [Steroidobacteraceae bacterium]
MIYRKLSSEGGVAEMRGKRGITILGAAIAVSTMLAANSVALAADTGAPAAPDNSLTMYGITLYGTVDIGLQYETHGVPISDYFPAGSESIIQKNSNHSVLGATPSNMSQSRIGLSGAEPLPGLGDWQGVFKVETFFNPQSGEIADALKSQVLNNGRALAVQTTNVDSSVAGQAFQQAFAGFSSKTFGMLTFGRQNTLLADGIAQYDPQMASQAFSLIGFSGTAAGGGDTEDRRLSSSLKYVEKYNGFHVGAEYKFNGATGGANSAYEFQLGADFAGLSVDAFYVYVRDAVATAALSAAQVTELPVLGFSPSNSLASTISDNRSYGIMATYNLGVPKVYAGYEHINFANPRTPLAAGFDDIGGYKLAFVNNAAFPHAKVLQVFWAGVKLAVSPKLDLTGAYYGYRQNSYGIGASAGCSSTLAATCSGAENAVSASLDYRFTKRFDAYAGLMWTWVEDGLASGFLNKSTVDPTIGIRFRF